MAAGKPARVCVPGAGKRGYCGRTGNPTAIRKVATCADCHAALRADEAHRERISRGKR